MLDLDDESPTSANSISVRPFGKDQNKAIDGQYYTIVESRVSLTVQVELDCKLYSNCSSYELN